MYKLDLRQCKGIRFSGTSIVTTVNTGSYAFCVQFAYDEIGGAVGIRVELEEF
jgi:hypothetical protein